MKDYLGGIQKKNETSTFKRIFALFLTWFLTWLTDFAISHKVTSQVMPIEEREYQIFSQILCLVICQVVSVSDHQDAVTVMLYTNLWNLGVKKFYCSGRSPSFPQCPSPTMWYYNLSGTITSHRLVHSPSVTVSLSDSHNTPVETFDFSLHQCMSLCMLQYR